MVLDLAAALVGCCRSRCCSVPGVCGASRCMRTQPADRRSKKAGAADGRSRQAQGAGAAFRQLQAAFRQLQACVAG